MVWIAYTENGLNSRFTVSQKRFGGHSPKQPSEWQTSALSPRPINFKKVRQVKFLTDCVLHLPWRILVLQTS